MLMPPRALSAPDAARFSRVCDVFFPVSSHYVSGGCDMDDVVMGMESATIAKHASEIVNRCSSRHWAAIGIAANFYIYAWPIFIVFAFSLQLHGLMRENCSVWRNQMSSWNLGTYFVLIRCDVMAFLLSNVSIRRSNAIEEVMWNSNHSSMFSFVFENSVGRSMVGT